MADIIGVSVKLKNKLENENVWNMYKHNGKVQTVIDKLIDIHCCNHTGMIDFDWN